VPAIHNPPGQWLGNHLNQINKQVRAHGSGGTIYVLNPTILNPSPTNPNCEAITGDISHDNFGNPTGLTGWGHASHKTGSWVAL